MANETISMGQVKRLINYTIDNNIELEKNGKDAIAVGFEAEAGIGKTSIIEQVAEERGMGFTKISCAQLEEVGDIIGFPCTEYECQVRQAYKDESGEIKAKVLPGTVWVNAKLMENPAKGFQYRQTGKTRMGYAKPGWVPDYNENGNIVLLDDMTRANSTILQSLMELILKREFISWKLPKKTTIFVTQNPDNGAYNVNSQDEAQNGRYLMYPVSWDMDAWAKWAEDYGLDGRCINFVLNYSGELFNADGEGNRICNPRSFAMFANMISGVPDWDNKENLAFINTIAKGCFKDSGGRFAQMFASFIRNKMHLLIQPKEMLEGKWDSVRGKMLEAMYDTNGQYRSDISHILERRFSNYVCAWLKSNDKTPIKPVVERIVDFVECKDKTGKVLFAPDVMYHMIKKITSENKQQTQKLLFEPKIARIMSQV